jgi:hypothetical protein
MPGDYRKVAWTISRITGLSPVQQQDNHLCLQDNPARLQGGLSLFAPVDFQEDNHTLLFVGVPLVLPPREPAGHCLLEGSVASSISDAT